MGNQMSIFSLIQQATLVVQIVLLILIVLSLFSWASIFRKYFAFSAMHRKNKLFERQFWSGAHLQDLYANASKHAAQGGQLERLFVSGMREFNKLKERRVNDINLQIEGVYRAMRATTQREVDAAEDGLSFLATVGSITPYIGLLGTVWGILHAFTGFSLEAQVSLATVAPAIAEALIATAVGLFAAIPAVVAYNRFSGDLNKIEGQMDAFGEEFANILQRNTVNTPATAGVGQTPTQAA